MTRTAGRRPERAGERSSREGSINRREGKAAKEQQMVCMPAKEQQMVCMHEDGACCQKEIPATNLNSHFELAGEGERTL